jgi:hypothetical protein
MNQKAQLLATKPGSHDQVSLVTVALRNVGEQFLVEKLDRIRIEVGCQLRKEKLQELDEESGQQFLTQAVMIHGSSPSKIS